VTAICNESEKVPIEVGVIVKSTVADDRLAIAPKSHVIVVEPLQGIPWLVWTAVNVNLVGSVSLSVTAVASSGPSFWTVALYVRFPPIPNKKLALVGLTEIATSAPDIGLVFRNTRTEAPAATAKSVRPSPFRSAAATKPYSDVHTGQTWG
jgi:hypothetical protein